VLLFCFFHFIFINFISASTEQPSPTLQHAMSRPVASFIRIRFRFSAFIEAQ
jgi:hypothetical protein